MKKIVKLTSLQESRMEEWKDKWIKIGLRTGETDWNTFDEYMPICYAKAGLQYPKRVVRVSSTLVGALASSIAHKIWEKRNSKSPVSESVFASVDESVHASVSESVSDSID